MANKARDALQLELAQFINLAARRIRARFTERAKVHDQTMSRFAVLYVLASEPDGLIQAEVAERIGVQGPTIVKLVDALEKQGMVSRRAEPGDRRAKRLHIEPAGMKARDELDAVASKFRDEVFDGFTDAELKSVSDLLKRISDRVRPVISED